MSKIYQVEYKRYSPTITIITATYKNSAEYPVGEYYLIDSDGNLLYAEEIRFDRSSFEDSLIELNDELMSRELLQQALLSLNEYLRNNIDEDYIDRPMINEETANYLAGLRFREKDSFIEIIGRKTRDNNLKDIMRKLKNLPGFYVSTL